MIKKCVCFLVAVLVFALASFSVSASSVPYPCYNYDYYENPVETPAAYVPYTDGSSNSLTGMLFNKPSDIFVDDNGKIYVLDSGNNTIEIFNSEFSHIKTIDGFMKGDSLDKFNQPEGIFVTKNGDIYVADTMNNRIVILSEKGELKHYIVNMYSDAFDADFEFLPTALVVDTDGRIYVISKHVFQGIMVFGVNNRFSNFTGTVDVTVSPIELFWKKISTKSQRQKGKLYVPTEFSGLDINEDGFLYTTNLDEDSKQMIKKLNPYGTDVLKNFTTHTITGDLKYSISGDLSGPTQFIDITVRENGIYSALDSVRGRIFTYDDEGHILYIFGGFGTQIGSFKKPVAIESVGDMLLVVDQDYGRVMAYKATNYGRLIEEAVSCRFLGDDEQSIEKWEQVLELDSRFELAYAGIGQSLLAEYKNEEAEEYLKKGHDIKNYSIAFKRNRLAFLQDNNQIILNGLLVLAVGLVITITVKKFIKKRKKGE